MEAGLAGLESGCDKRKFVDAGIYPAT